MTPSLMKSLVPLLWNTKGLFAGHGGSTVRKLLVVRISSRWHLQLLSNFVVNCIVNYEATFNKSSAGWFILPEFDEENGTNSALRSLLKVFIEASWGTYTLCFCSATLKPELR